MELQLRGRNWLGWLSLLLLIGLLAAAVVQMIYSGGNMSEVVEDPDAGLNGSFETVSEGLPVNWMLYTQNTVQEGDFDIVIDTENAAEGSQSLKFDIRSCSPQGGWYSPGLAQEIAVTPGKEYNLSFQIRNSGAQFHIKAGPVAVSASDMRTIVHTAEPLIDWLIMDYNILIPENFKTLRFEVNLLTPGQFWIDDISITEMQE